MRIFFYDLWKKAVIHEECQQLLLKTPFGFLELIMTILCHNVIYDEDGNDDDASCCSGRTLPLNYYEAKEPFGSGIEPNLWLLLHKKGPRWTWGTKYLWFVTIYIRLLVPFVPKWCLLVEDRVNSRACCTMAYVVNFKVGLYKK